MFGLNLWAKIFLILWIVIWFIISVLFFQKKRTLKKVLKFSLYVIIFIFILTSLVVISMVYDYKGIDRGIVMEKEVKVFSGPDESETELFIIHEGTKVEIKRDTGDWIEVRLVNGAVGWIHRNTIEII